MAKLLDTVTFEAQSVYNAKGNGVQLGSWVNDKGRTVTVTVQARLGGSGGLLANTAANFTIGFGIKNAAGTETFYAVFHPARAKYGAAAQRVVLEIGPIDVQNGETLYVRVNSDNAGDTDVDGSVLFFDLNDGSNVVSVGGESPSSFSDEIDANPTPGTRDYYIKKASNLSR